MQLKNKKIGVWGLSVVGKAAVTFLHVQQAIITVCDNKKLTTDDLEFLATHNAQFIPQDCIDVFMQSNDLIIPSPGINTNNYRKIYNKFLEELDLFYIFCTKPIIAITGSIGKTTVTSLLGASLQAHFSVLIGGNIGIPALSLLAKQHEVDYIILEVSSFQLEQCKIFAPHFAIVTNIHPNHLDRHNTIAEYVNAKINIFAHQAKTQKSLLPESFINKLHQTTRLPSSQLLSFCDCNTNGAAYCTQAKKLPFFFIQHNKIYGTYGTNTYFLCNIKHMPPITYAQNWLVVVATVYDIKKIKLLKNNTIISNAIPHRLEKIATINNTDFYNDSKATIPASTLAAVKQLEKKSIHLFLGGLSKGVDRTDFIFQLRTKVFFIYCFGKEAPILYALCNKYNIPCACFDNLSDAFYACTRKIKQKDVVLFSPSGSSYDLFADYAERGNYFKHLVENLKKSIQ
jgi:UDP-N-acetylmuramoylalanine--D-glutamate ligase